MGKETERYTPGPANFAQLRGVWRSRGYGIVLHLAGAEYTLYEETAVSCLPVFAGSLDELGAHYADLRVSPGRQSFSVRRAAGTTRVGFRRLKALPPNAAPPDTAARHDALFNFDILWHTFAENYALFDLRGIDWDATYRKFRPEIDAETPPERLFDVFVEMLRPLGDGHVDLRTPYGQFNAGIAPPLVTRLTRELARAEDARDVHAYLADLREWLRETIHDDYLETAARSAGNRLFEWGRLDERTGYLAIRAMAGQSGKVGRPREDADVAVETMRRVVQEFAALPSVVIDLRGNGGGYDVVALRIAAFLTDRRRVALYKSARFGAGFTGQHPVYVEPREGDRYAGRIILLTSGLTASAAEVLVLALLQHPRVTRVGETTHGILSDVMERHLPNGWFVTLSNELYRAADGEIYEERGVPPHVEMPFLERRSREQGRDNMLDHAIAGPAAD